MNLSRKRQRELNRLRAAAEEVLYEQKEVMGRAGTVLQEASRQAKLLSDEHVAPRVQDALNNARPVLNRGVWATRNALSSLRRVTAPVVTGALVSTIRALDSLDDDRARVASKSLSSFGQRSGIIEKPRRRAGSVVGTVLAVAAVVGVGYALWQTFRADDELWVAGELENPVSE